MNFAPLRQRDFGLLWWAGLISLAGNWALAIALPIYVLRLTGSASAVSAVVGASLLAGLLFGSFAGAYVDRWDRRRVVVAVNLAQAVVLLPLLLVDSASRVPIVVGVAFVSSALDQFFLPAENALLPRLVAAEHLTAANALNSLNNNIARLVGPALGGIAAASFGLGGSALIDAASFLVAAGLCVLISGRHRVDSPRRHLLRELVEGLGAVARNRIVRAIFVLVAITSIGEGMLGTLFAVYVTRGLHGTGREMGWLMSAQAVGGILGSLAGTRATTRIRPVSMMSACFVAFGLIDLVIFNYPRWDTTLWPVMVLFVLVGLPVGIGMAGMMTLFQIQTPDRLRGRVFAALGVAAAVAGLLGTGIAGWLGDSVSVVNLLTAQGAGYVLAGVLLRVLAGPGPESLVEAPVEVASPVTV
jgi:MFS family permease